MPKFMLETCELMCETYEKITNSLFLSSVRSKVRGKLEIYHAYIRDLDAAAAPEPDWEIVDTNETNVSI